MSHVEIVSYESCSACHGTGDIEIIDTNGDLDSKVCPKCSGSGKVQIGNWKTYEDGEHVVIPADTLEVGDRIRINDE